MWTLSEEHYLYVFKLAGRMMIPELRPYCTIADQLVVLTSEGMQIL